MLWVTVIEEGAGSNEELFSHLFTADRCVLDTFKNHSNDATKSVYYDLQKLHWVMQGTRRMLYWWKGDLGMCGGYRGKLINTVRDLSEVHRYPLTNSKTQFPIVIYSSLRHYFNSFAQLMLQKLQGRHKEIWCTLTTFKIKFKDKTVRSGIDLSKVTQCCGEEFLHKSNHWIWIMAWKENSNLCKNNGFSNV